MAKKEMTTEQSLAEQLPTTAELQAKLDAMSAELARVTRLLGQSTDQRPDPADQAHREWAQLSAEEKTKLELDRLYPAQAGDSIYKVKHVGEDGKPTECFPLAIPARSSEEAEIRYRKLMGIRETKGTIIAQAS